MPGNPSPTRLAPLDLAVVALYLIGITLFGLTFSRRASSKSGKNSLQRYFLADNTIPWWAIALSIVSAETSTLTIISIPGVAFAGNLGFLQVVLGYLLGRVVVSLLFLPRYFRGEMLTAYQLIDRRFGRILYKLTAGLFLLTRAAAEGVRVFAISIVVGIAIGTNDILSIALISGLTLLYTFEGGMAAVIWTDVVQMGLYLAGTIVAMVTLGHQIPGGWNYIYLVGEHSAKFQWLDFSFSLTKSYTFWAGILGGTFLTMASHGTDQLMVQRMLAARNLNAARTALLSSGVVIFVQFTLFLLIGVGLFVFYGAAGVPGAPSIAPSSQAMGGIATLSPDRIFPTFIVQQMPHGVAGLLVAAILAAAMSNLSAALNSLASTTVVDFYLPWRKVNNDRERTLISRAATIFWAIVLFAIAVYSIQAGGKGHVVETGLSIASVAYGSLLGVFLLGTLTRYATQTGAIAGMISGLAVNLTLWQAPAKAPWNPHIAFTWYVLIGAVVTFAIGSLVSLRRKRRTALLLILLGILGAPSIPASSEWVGRQMSVPKGQAPEAPTHRDETAMNGAPQGGGQQTNYDFTPVSTLINTAIAQHKLPGAVVVIGHKGKIVFERAYGNRALEPKVEPMTTDTIFDMASLTKVLVTTTAILQLYEQHKLDLDAPVAKYLPEFAATTGCAPPQTPGIPIKADVLLSNSKDSRPLCAASPAIANAKAWKSQITIRQLLTHYSGLSEDVDLKDPWGVAAPDKAEGIRRAMAAVPYGPPGETFKYSDINFITLGALVEKISGQTLDDLANANIFHPLNLNDTSFHPWCTCDQGSFPPYPKKYPGGHPKAEMSPAAVCESNPCSALDWGSYTRTAPTAHDDQGTPQTNPNFDHLLRGTVHDPTTRRMGGVAGHAGVFSTAEDAARFCDALLAKLLRNEGPFPLQQATLKLATSPNQPATAVDTATIFTQDGQPTKGVASRGLGWDLNTAFSRPRGTIFPITTAGHPGSFGHTGFTGTSLWLDPTSDTYVVLLANAIHPRGAPTISPLRGEVATAAAKALGLDAAGAPSIPASSEWVGSQTPEPRGPAPELLTHREETAMNGAPRIVPISNAERLARQKALKAELKGHYTAPWGSEPDPEPQTLTGIDVLEQTHFAALKTLAQAHGGHLRLGLLTNQSGLDSQDNRTIDILLHADPAIELKTLFTPEHGLLGKQDTEHLAAEQDAATHLPVVSLYGAKPADRRPRLSDLKQLDAVVIDLQDAGVRTYTYETLTGYFLEACAHAGIPLIVLDRPNPIGGVAVQGPLTDPGVGSYTDFMPIPLRHGLTLGELARYFNTHATEIKLKPELLDGRALQFGANISTHTGDPDKPPATLPGLHAALTVIPMQNWHRSQYFDQTGLIFTPPSPNLRTVQAAVLLPALTLVEATNLSVGRGSATPFEAIAASYLDPATLLPYLEARHIPGIRLTHAQIAIAEDQNHYPGHGQTIPGIHLDVTDRAAFDAPEFGLELLAALHHLYPKDFQLERAKSLLANAAVLDALKAGKDPREIAASYAAADADFRSARAAILLYR
jgi:SSS family transporter